MIFKKDHVAGWSFLALTALYVVLALTLPTDPKILEKYQIDQAQSRLLSLTIIVPIVLIYLTALYGFIRFKRYSASIQDTNEGRPFEWITRGLTVLVFSLPALSVVSSLLTYTSFRYPDLLPTITIARNYLSLILPLTAFTLLEKGARGLYQTLKRTKSHSDPLLSPVVIIVLSVVFTWLVTTRQEGVSGETAYYLPTWLIITTLAIPFLYTWCKGIMAAFYLFIYKNRVKGTIYRSAIAYLSMGLGTILFSSISIQALTTVSARLNRLNLTPILIIIYILVGLYAVGYGLVAHGAKQLKKIEEV